MSWKQKWKNSDTEDSDNISLHDSSEEDQPPLRIKLNDFVLIRFVRKQTLKFFVGIVDEINLKDNEIHVDFLKKKRDCMKFVYPDKVDVSWVDFHDVEMVLTPLQNYCVTLRGAACIIFSKNVQSISRIVFFD